MRLPPRIHAALVAVALRLDCAGVPWVVTGSTGRALLGAAVRPRDLDLETRPADFGAAAAALGLTRAADAAGAWDGRRALGVLAGVELDLSAGVTVRGPGGVLVTDDDLVAEHAVRCAVPGGPPVAVAPPEEHLCRVLVAGDWGRVARLAAGDPPPPRTGYVARRLAAASAAR